MPSTDAKQTWREKLGHVIFTTNSPAAKAFDIVLLIAIVLSVFAVCLETVKGIEANYHRLFFAAEWVFTIVFTLEYAARLATARRPARYARSFFGVIDLLSILPTYVSFFIPGAQSLIIIRVLRLIRVFRVFKLARFVGESEILLEAIRNSREKIIVFIVGVTSLTVVVGSLMYLIEGGDSGFTSIPQGIYWAIVTLTTVGYGSIEPVTVGGRVLASVVMIMGYGIIAVPTGIVTAELTRARPKPTPAGGLAYNAVESYKLLDDGSIQTTYTYNKGAPDGALKTMTPTGFVHDTTTNATWKMRFVWPFKAEYLIVHLHDDYTQTIIGRTKRDYAWVMTRSPTPGSHVITPLIEKLGRLGYDTSKVRLATTDAEAKLARQRTIYERDLERLRKRIESQLESKKRTVQKSGTTTETDRLLAEIDAYESRGEIPDVRAADSIRRGYAKAAGDMMNAYNRARLEPGGDELFSDEADHFEHHWDLTPWRALPLPSPGEPATLTPDQPITLPNELTLPFRLEVTAEAIDDDATLAVEFQSAEGTRLAVRAAPDDRGRFRVLLTIDEDFVAADLGLTRPIDRSHAYVSDTTDIELFAKDGAVRISSARIKPVIDDAPPRAQVAGKAGNRSKEPEPNPLPQGSEWTGTLFGESAGARVATVKVIRSNDTSATLSASSSKTSGEPAA
eukprot:g5616.t1